MKLYSIYNEQTERFNPPFVARDNDDAQEIVRKAIIGGRDLSLLVELENLSLEFVGTFDAVNGAMSKDGVFGGFCVRLNEIPLPDHIQKLIDKMKEVKE